MNLKYKKIVINILAFLMPMIILIMIWHAQGIEYGKGLTIFTYDMRTQYAAFLAGLRYLVNNPKELLFNWNYCLGGNYFGVFAYYLASPLNLITLFWSIEDLPDALYVLTLLKIGLCGLSFNLFLQGRFKEKGIRFSNLVFVICYTLMSYNIVYMFCIMWIDAWILLPLILLGIEQILEDKKSLLYFFSVTLLFISNYYMAYIVGVYVAIYFVVRLIEKRKMEQCAIYLLRIGLKTIFALLISMPIVLPALLNINKRFGSGIDGTQIRISEIEPVKVILKLLPFQYDSLLIEGGYPNIYCGILMYILAVVYFFQKRPIREKVCSIFTLLIIGSGFFIEKMNWFWHGFQLPHGLPYRFSFLFSVAIILCAYNAWIELKYKSSITNIILAMISLCTVVEVGANGIVVIQKMKDINGYEGRAVYNLNHTLYEPLAEEIKKETGFYRMCNSEHFVCYNSEVMYGLKGVNFSSSSNLHTVYDFLKNVGSCDLSSCINGYSLSPLIDSLLGIKYRIAMEDPMLIYDEILNTSCDDSYFRLYKNENALSLGYMIPNNQEVEWNHDPFENQIKLLNAIGIEQKDVYEPLPYELKFKDNTTDVEITVDFQVGKNRNVSFYFECAVYTPNLINYYIDGELFEVTGEYDSKRIITIPRELEEGHHKLEVRGKYGSLSGFYMYAFDKNAYQSVVDRLSKNQLTNIELNGNVINGSVNVDKDKIMLFTIPYDEGYAVFVDGKKVDIQKVLGVFIGVELDEGQHVIKIVYVPKGLLLGMSFMIIGIISSALYFYKTGKNS